MRGVEAVVFADVTAALVVAISHRLPLGLALRATL